MQIKYTKGDATNPKGIRTKIIVHICNDIGGWGKGFVMAVSNRWKAPETSYRAWFKSKTGLYSDNLEYVNLSELDETEFALGNVQFVMVDEGLWVANLIGQHKIRKGENRQPPIRYEAVQNGLKKVSVFAKKEHASVHMPRIGCGLAGGKWDEIESIVNEELIKRDISTTVYDFG